MWHFWHRSWNYETVRYFITSIGNVYCSVKLVRCIDIRESQQSVSHKPKSKQKKPKILEFVTSMKRTVKQVTPKVFVIVQLIAYDMTKIDWYLNDEYEVELGGNEHETCKKVDHWPEKHSYKFVVLSLSFVCCAVKSTVYFDSKRKVNDTKHEVVAKKQ